MNHQIAWTVRIATFLAFLIGPPSFAESLIPRDRPSGVVVDLAGLLSPADVAELRRIGAAVKTKNNAELVVLTIGSTGGANPRALATATFNSWKLGDASRNSGLLLFVAAEDRAAEIILGDGIDGDAQVAASDRIMQEEMLPRFRNGDAAGAIVAGAQTCAERFFGVPFLRAEALSFASTAAAPAPTWTWGTLFAVLAIVIPGLGFGARLFFNWKRHRPRPCRKCQKPMTLLDETKDDAHLLPGELKEEMLGSVDYDAWVCLDCGEVEKRKFFSWMRSHLRCNRCGYETSSRVEKVIRSASLQSAGKLQIRDLCENCGNEAETFEVIPRKTLPISSRSGGGKSFLGGGFSGRSSRGGGSSSGRGSSGRW